MNHLYFLILSCFLTGLFSACRPPQASPDERITSSPFEDRIDSLLSLMTLEEKVGQLNQHNGSWDMTGPPPENLDVQEVYDRMKNGMVGSMLNTLSAKATYEAQKLVMENSRLKIPLIFGHDVIHGYKTMFPIPLAEAASWDLEAIERSAQIAATEASAAGVHWTFAPMVDIARDARWGRIMEGAGEDPYLGSLVAKARVRGFQGNDLSANNTIAACAKHFAAYGFAVDGRDYNTVDIGRSTLHNVVLPPFKAAVEAGVATFMNGFNELNGVPVTANAYLQRDLLKERWGFDGFVVSDWNSIGEMISHGYAADSAAAAIAAIEGGSDMDMECSIYLKYLPDLVSSGKVDEALIDDAVRRILRVKFQLGLFEDPYRYSNEAREKEMLGKEAHMQASRDVARKSMVLLKNSDAILPLDPSMKIAVIGPLANDKDSPLGNWRSQAVPNSAVSVLEGIKNVATGTVSYTKGCDLVIGDRSFIHKLQIETSDRSGFAAARAIAKQAEVVVMVLGEDCYMSGEARSRAYLDLPGLQQELLEEIYKVNKNIVLVLMNGRPLAVKWAADNVPAILEAWFPGSEGGNAVADVLFGAYNPSGKLPVTFPQTVGQEPMYYNKKSTGRPSTEIEGFVGFTRFEDVSNEPLFPFGYGLSYSSFEYSGLALDKKELTPEETLEVTVTLRNTSEVKGKETVQLYIRDMAASLTRPVMELKDFRQVELAPGESREIRFTLDKTKLSFFDLDGNPVLEPGEFTVFIGGNSREVLQDSFQLK